MSSVSVRLLSADLDGTLLGEAAGTAHFIEHWRALPPGLRPVLVYNTGRSAQNVRDLIAARCLPEPDYIIGGIGTELYSNLYDYTREFQARFCESWDVDRVSQIVRDTPGTRLQPAEFLHRFKTSWYWTGALSSEVAGLRQRLAAAGIAAHVDYSCRYFLDVLPARAGKGNALEWLANRLGIPNSQILVAGDTGNDIPMFLLKDVKGIIVQNALPELSGVLAGRNFFRAQFCGPEGVVEGLRHFGVMKAVDLQVCKPNIVRALRWLP